MVCNSCSSNAFSFLFILISRRECNSLIPYDILRHVLQVSYTADNVVEGKRASKQALQQRLGLKTADLPLVGIITRLTHQKGIHLIKHAIRRTLDRNGQVVYLSLFFLFCVSKNNQCLDTISCQFPYLVNTLSLWCRGSKCHFGLLFWLARERKSIGSILEMLEKCLNMAKHNDNFKRVWECMNMSLLDFYNRCRNNSIFLYVL